MFYTPFNNERHGRKHKFIQHQKHLSWSNSFMNIVFVWTQNIQILQTWYLEQVRSWAFWGNYYSICFLSEDFWCSVIFFFHTRLEVSKLQLSGPAHHFWSTAYFCMAPERSIVFTFLTLKKEYFATQEGCRIQISVCVIKLCWFTGLVGITYRMQLLWAPTAWMTCVLGCGAHKAKNIPLTGPLPKKMASPCAGPFRRLPLFSSFRLRVLPLGVKPLSIPWTEPQSPQALPKSPSHGVKTWVNLALRRWAVGFRRMFLPADVQTVGVRDTGR